MNVREETDFKKGQVTEWVQVWASTLAEKHRRKQNNKNQTKWKEERRGFWRWVKHKQ